MKVKRSCVLPIEKSEVAKLLGKVSTLQHVSSPLLTFRFVNQTPTEWREGSEYELKLRILGILPAGRHLIQIAELSEDKVSSVEHGLLAKTWNHDILLESQSDGQTLYTDIIEIRSGVLTPLVWLFAWFFYRHRQKRWRKMLGS